MTATTPVDRASPPAAPPAVPRVLDIAAKFILVVAAALATVLLAIAIAYTARGKVIPGSWITIGVFIIVSLALWAALRLPPGKRLGAAFGVTLIVCVVYALELYLTLHPPPRVPSIVARERGTPFDERFRFQVVKDLRGQGVEAYPALAANFLREGEGQLRFTLVLGADTVVPLAPGPANGTAVLCNENGTYVSYVADEFGFNNPKGLWPTAGVDVAVLGDSFTHGACVAPPDHFVSRIRERRPRTLNVGIYGAGPLHMLAIAREYLALVRPRVMVWTYYEGNDLQDLRDELGSASLRAYLSDGFRRGLPSHQPDIDRQMSRFLDSLVDHFGEPSAGNAVREFVDRVTPLVTLTSLRLAAGFDRPAPDAAQVEMLRQILLSARDLTASWGGSLYFVYLPTYRRFGGRDNESFRLRAGVLSAARSVGVPIIDLVPAFRDTANPTGFWYHPRTHYNERGNAVVSDSILNGIAAAQ